jgi:hypothetical protein
MSEMNDAVKTLQMVADEVTPVALFHPDRDMNEGVLCHKCVDEIDYASAEMRDSTGEPAIREQGTKLYPVNLRPYSQCCHRCGEMVFVGTTDVILYGEKPQSLYAHCDPREMKYLGINPDGTDIAKTGINMWDETSESEAEMLYENNMGENPVKF